MDMVRDLGLAGHLRQELAQIRPVGHGADFLGHAVKVGDDLQPLLLIDPDGDVQDQFQSYIALLPIEIRPHRQLLLPQMAADVRQHPLPAAMAFQHAAEGDGGLKAAAGMVLPLALVQNEEMDVP